MLLALIVTLLLPTMSRAVVAQLGTQTIWPLTFTGIPVLLGLLGAAFALFRRRYVWAALSALWGFVLVFGGYYLYVLAYGP